MVRHSSPSWSRLPSEKACAGCMISPQAEGTRAGGSRQAGSLAGRLTWCRAWRQSGAGSEAHSSRVCHRKGGTGRGPGSLALAPVVPATRTAIPALWKRPPVLWPKMVAHLPCTGRDRGSHSPSSSCVLLLGNRLVKKTVSMYCIFCTCLHF